MPNQTQDAADSYERAKPEHESGMGRLTNNKGTPTDRPDQMKDATKNRKDPAKHVNADDSEQGDRPDHSMHDEEPMGADLRPNAIPDRKNRRYPKTDGKGGTP